MLYEKVRAMLGNWKNWCRLCANIDSTHADMLYKTEISRDQLEIVYKFFMISVLPFEGVQSSVCEDCHSFLRKLDGFRDRYIKADQMFRELIYQENLSNSDLQNIRWRFGLDNKEIEYEEQNPIDLRMLSHDPLEEIEDSVEVTQDPETETVPAPVPKKRGRSKSKPCQPKKKLDDKPLSMKETTSNTKTKKKEHICGVCSKKFSIPCLLKEHIWAQHCKEDKPYECSQCQKRFSAKSYLRTHMEIHLPDDVRRIHPCPQCDKKFSKKINVKIHMNAMHIREKPFICEECGKCCGTKSALKQHMDTHTEERNFQCPFCPKMFKSQHQVKKHEKWHKNTIYPCPQCDAKLGSKVTLKRHMLVHSDTRQYKCNYCGREFKRSKTLKNHLILHTGERPYECEFCNKTFANGSNYRTHQKRLHPAELAASEASGERPRMTIKIPTLDELLQPK